MDSGLENGWKLLGDAADGIIGSQGLLACLALGLACVFVLSGIPKLRKPDLAALAIVDFGLMRRSRAGAGVGLGLAECGLAIALGISAASSSTPVRAIPAIAAAALLWFFVALVGRSLRSGSEFACFCFGSGESRLSAFTLLRTAVLALAATVLAIGSFEPVPAPSAEEWMLALLVAVSGTAIVVLASKVPVLVKVSA